MQETERAGLSPRAIRGIALIGVALVGLAVGLAAYLRVATAPVDTGPPPHYSQPVPVSMDWRTPAQGWIVAYDSGGPESVLFRTTSGGSRWQRQFTIGGPAFVAFTDASSGILRADAAQAAGAQLLRTDDGGAHWRPVILPTLGQGTATTPFFLDGRRGWLLASRSTDGERSVVFGTTDGGQTWRSLGAPGPLSDQTDLLNLAFVSADSGWAYGSAAAGGSVLYATRDGGLSWAPETLPIGPTGPRAPDSLDVSGPVVTADGQGVLPVYDRGSGEGWVYASGDGGTTWGDPRPLPKSTGSRPPAFLDATAGWTSDPSTAWVTVDGGRTWRPTAGLPRGWQFSVVTPVSASMAWASAALPGRTGALGPVGWALFRTTDAGAHWTRVALPSLS